MKGIRGRGGEVHTFLKLHMPVLTSKISNVEAGEGMETRRTRHHELSRVDCAQQTIFSLMTLSLGKEPSMISRSLVVKSIKVSASDNSETYHDREEENSVQ